MENDRELEPLGWNAIDDVVNGIYGDTEPKHWGTVLPYSLGGRDPLTGLSAYRDIDDGASWHFVTYGFSELYEKEWDDPEISGFGFELTFRLQANDLEEHATWVFNFLQNLARYVFDTGRRFGQGHTMPLNGPIRSESDTKIVGIAFVRDPQLDKIDTPNGEVQFLQVVGLTEDELEAIQYWNAQSFLELVAEKNPKLVTDLDRRSYLGDERFAETVRVRSTEEGASCSEFHADRFSFSTSRWTRKCTLTLGAFLVEDLVRRLCGRIPYGREFLVSGGLDDRAIVFIAGDENKWSIDGETLTIHLTAQAATAFREEVLPIVGTYTIPGLERFAVLVERTEIRDNDGNVTKVVG